LTVKPSPRTTFAVTPVVDYEPPPRTVEHCRGSSPARRHTTRAPRRHGGPQPPAPEAATLPMRQAAVFADAALRRVLEVIDRRRPVAQLRPLLAASLVDAVLAVNRAAASHAAAVLRRVRLQVVGCAGGLSAAEVFGTYSRGRRIHAIACRVEQVPATDGTRWQVVALHIG
jgi:hypothetical protein